MSSGVHARVLIVARDDALAGPLADGLDRLGWRTVTARGAYAALAARGDLQIEAAIVDLASGGAEASRCWPSASLTLASRSMGST
jgi:two-component system cell cycle response regulator PopA